MKETNSSDQENGHLRFSVRLLIKHPNIDPSRITETLKLEPHLSRFAGTDRQTPLGDPLPGINKESVWSYSFDVVGKRQFFQVIPTLLETLSPHKRFFHQLADSGGTADLIIDLSGEINIGDVALAQDLKNLSELQINLGIEVYPRFRRREEL